MNTGTETLQPTLRLALKNSQGDVVRTVNLATPEAIVIQFGPAKRLEILSSEEELAHYKKRAEKERVPFVEVTRASQEKLQSDVDLIAGMKLGPLKAEKPLADVQLAKPSGRKFAVSLAGISLAIVAFLVTILNLNIGMHKLEQEIQQQVVQIVKKLPPKKTTVANTNPTQAVQTKNSPKAFQRMGALAVLGSLSKSGQKGGLNMNAVQTTAGPGLGGNAGSGGVQTNIYARGLAAAPLGAGGNLQGGGGYGTKGKGGGQAGYGTLSIVGSNGTSSIPLSSEASVGGGLDKDLIGAVIAKNLGQIRFCYEQGLQLEPSLHGRVAVDFTIDGSGIVKIANVQSSSLNSKQVEDCMLMRLRSWKFPLPENGKDVKVSYPFVLRRTGQG